jgi:hypothetical protein
MNKHLIFMLITVASLARAGAQTPSPWPPATRSVPGFSERAAALSPAEPEAYLLLGEELAAEAVTDEDIALARQLLAMAVDSALRQPQSDHVTATACTALAAYAVGDADQRWYRAIAESFRLDRAATDWAGSVDPPLSRASLLDAAEMLDAVRAGNGVRARRLLDRPDVRRVIERFGPMIAGESGRNLLDRLEGHAGRWPCTQCRNRRVVSEIIDEFPSTFICPTCQGDPGWNPPPAVLVGMLRFEALALGSIQRSWGAQFAVDRGLPLRTPDAQAVAGRVGVSFEKPYLIDGVWSQTPLSTHPADQ